ncbi:hypothetical protein J8L84_04765, partial [Alteromonas sp. MMG017]|uniref:hypothetical protein n=1 Tax=Alteromonas sp. MMG017 TaxID=2822692 RepID=UPI001B3A3158
LLELNPIDGTTSTPTISGTSERIGETVTITLLDDAGVTTVLTAIVQNDGTFSVTPVDSVSLGDLDVGVSVSDGAGGNHTDSLTQLINVAPNIGITTFDTSGEGSILGSVSPEYAGYELTVSLTVVLLSAVTVPLTAKTVLIQSDGSYEIIGLGLDIFGLASVDISISMTDAAGNLVTLESSSDSSGNISAEEPASTSGVEATSLEADAAPEESVVLLSAQDLGSVVLPTAPIEEVSLTDEGKGSSNEAEAGIVPPVFEAATIQNESIDLPGENDVVPVGSLDTNVTLALVDVELPPEDLVLPASEPSELETLSSAVNAEEAGNEALPNTEESTDSSISISDSDILRSAVEKLPPTDI